MRNKIDPLREVNEKSFLEDILLSLMVTELVYPFMKTNHAGKMSIKGK
jgi:hypothetical protein